MVKGTVKQLKKQTGSSWSPETGGYEELGGYANSRFWRTEKTLLIEGRESTCERIVPIAEQSKGEGVHGARGCWSLAWPGTTQGGVVGSQTQVVRRDGNRYHEAWPLTEKEVHRPAV